MTTPYDKILKRADPKAARKHIGGYRANVHRISFDDSDDSSRIDVPNIFLDDRENTQELYSPVKRIPKEYGQHRQPIKSIDSSQNLQMNSLGASPSKDPSSASPPSKPPRRLYQDAQPEQPQQIAEPQPQIQPNSSLSVFQIFKLNLGEYLFRNQYPLKKTIYINNNNQEENQINQKQYLMKNKAQRQLSHFSNSLKMSQTLYFLALLFRNVFGYLYIYTWLAVIIFHFIAEKLMLKTAIQYGNDKASMIVFFVLAVVIQIFADWLSFRKRKKWEQNDELYKVYHHNGHMAEWSNVQGSLIKAGNIYKMSKGQIFPTDCIILHCESSLIKINETAIISHLVQHPSQITLKQSIIKTQNVPLPASGFLSYEIGCPQYTDYQIVGKLNLEQPQKTTYQVGMINVVLRGTLYVSQKEIICMTLQTGIDSLLLKHLQYPFAQNKQYQYSTPIKTRQISQEVSAEIKEYQNTFLGCNLEKKCEEIVFIMFLVYVFMIAFGLLVRFAFERAIQDEFYLGKEGVQIWKVVIYHITNFLGMVPVLIIPMFKVFVVLSGTIAQMNISKRAIQLVSQSVVQKRASSIIESTSSKHQELLDNKKIIFPLSIKDYSLLPQLCKTDTIITTIDTFRDEASFTLHSVKVRDIHHNFLNNNSALQAYSVEQLQMLKTVMSVSLLTATKKDDYHAEVASYDVGIQYACRRYLQLVRNKNAKGQTVINRGQYQVKQLFHIEPTYEYPFKIVFCEPTGEDTQQQNHNQSKILVLLRGHTKTILDKCYGKEVALVEESRKLEEEKGYHVELIGKLTLHGQDAGQIRNAYYSGKCQKKTFYKNLDKYLGKVQAMGLLVFVNQFNQRKIGQSLKNPILNKSILHNPLSHPPSSSLSDILTSSSMPNLIILAPLSLSSQPQFQSIHTITNLLISPYLFNLGLSEVGDKIYHQKPGDLDRMFQNLEEERVVVWNGWDFKDVCYTVQVMKKYGRNIMYYGEKDQYMHLMKQCAFSVKGNNNQGYDSNKYSDINLTSKSSISYLYLLQLLKYDSIIVRQALLNILFTQFGKYLFYFVIEFINLFYTRGTGLNVIKTPLFLVVQVVLFTDVMYYLNWKDGQSAWTFNKKMSFMREVLITVAVKVSQGIFITLICFYSLQTPSGSSGTPHPYQYPHFCIVFTFLHILLFQKLFSLISQSFSIYKSLVLLCQLILLYISFVIISVSDKYIYKAILWSALAEGNVFVTTIVCIWICLTVPAIRLMWNFMKGRKNRGRESRKNK